MSTDEKRSELAMKRVRGSVGFMFPEVAELVEGLLAERADLAAALAASRADTDRQIAIRQHAQEAHAAACNALSAALQDAAAARVEVSQLRAKIETARGILDDWANDRDDTLRLVVLPDRISLALADPLGSTPSPPAIEEKR